MLQGLVQYRDRITPLHIAAGDHDDVSECLWNQTRKVAGVSHWSRIDLPASTVQPHSLLPTTFHLNIWSDDTCHGYIDILAP
jgi:hypothetical protein